MVVTLIHFIIKQGIVDMIFKDGILGLNHREKNTCSNNPIPTFFKIPI